MNRQDLISRAKGCSLPALHLIHAHGDRFSRLGGLPAVPHDFRWPEWKGEPLSFLAQIDLSEVADSLAQQWLPHTGQLYFFYDKEQSTWGFDPADRGSWRVIYTDCEKSLLKAGDLPPGIGDDVFTRSSVLFQPILSLPDWQRMGDIRDLEQDQVAELCDLRDTPFRQQPKHQMFGYPSPVQGDSMELECQLASNGIYVGTPDGYQADAAQTLAAGASDWRLLLQLDTDDKLGMMWGDVGTLYFWIRQNDATRREFDNVWLVLQCA